MPTTTTTEFGEELYEKIKNTYYGSMFINDYYTLSQYCKKYKVRKWVVKGWIRTGNIVFTKKHWWEQAKTAVPKPLEITFNELWK